MRILIDIGHPAHVHLFRNIYHELSGMNHKFFVTVKDIPAAKKLLGIYQIPYIDLGAKKDSFLGKAVHQLRYNAEVYKLIRSERIDLGMGSSITIPQVSKLTGMTSFVMDDDDDVAEPLFVKFGHTFSDCIFTPDSIKRKSKKSIYYPGTHELAYLHPKRFTPDPSVISELGLTEGQPYFIMRFNAFRAHHDSGSNGLNLTQKIQLVQLLSGKGKVFITAERDLEPELKKYQLIVSPEKIHSVLYYATAYVGDSQTMTSEAAVLGTPAFKCNTFAGNLSVPNELEERYKLCFSYKPGDFDKMVSHLQVCLDMENLKAIWMDRRDHMLAEKIDVTGFFSWVIRNFPGSIKELKDNPAFFSENRQFC